MEESQVEEGHRVQEAIGNWQLAPGNCPLNPPPSTCYLLPATCFSPEKGLPAPLLEVPPPSLPF